MDLLSHLVSLSLAILSVQSEQFNIMFQDPSCFSEVLIRYKVKTRKGSTVNFRISHYYIFIFTAIHYLIIYLFFVWTSKVPRNVEDLGKQTTLATKIEMNGRKNSRMSCLVKAVLSVGSQVAAGVTSERKTYTNEFCVEVSMVV